MMFGSCPHRFATRLLIILCALLAAISVTAAPRVSFKTWTTENGLPQNSVNRITQTRDGYIWIATNDGIARFDGIRFTVFKKSNTPELLSNRIAIVLTDDLGRLWIFAFNTNGLVLYDRGHFWKFDRLTDLSWEALGGVWVEGQNTIFSLGTVEYVFDGQEFSSRAPKGRTISFGYDMRTSTHWIDDGGFHYAIRNGRIESYPAADRPVMTSLWLSSHDGVFAAGALWFLLQTEKSTHLARFRDGALALSRPLPYVVSHATIVTRDRHGNLWIGYRYEGAMRIDASTMSGEDLSGLQIDHLGSKDGMASDAVATFFLDRDENLWMGGTAGLQLVHDNLLVEMLTLSSGLPDDNIYAIAEDNDGVIWFGAWDTFLVRYKDGQVLSTRQDFVTALFLDQRHGMLAGAHSGIWRWTGNGLENLSLDGLTPVTIGEISFISRDRNGQLWVGGSEGLLRYHESRGVRSFQISDGLPAIGLTAFMETGSGELWFGTTAGLARLDGDRFTAFTARDGLSGDFIRSLDEDASGAIWIGTYDSGITRLKDGEFAGITSAHGLFSDGVFCMLEDDDGWLWMNSNQGIHRAKLSELNELADGLRSSINSVSYGPSDGLFHVEGNGGKQPAGLRSSDGRLWFPMHGGVAIVDPKKAKRTDSPPATLIESVSIDREDAVGVSEGFRIEPSQTAIEIAYTAIDFQRPDQIRFRYRMEGLDEKWNEVGTRRSAYFSHLPYGEYTFQITAANSSGVWNDKIASIRIVVVPPFYSTAWFIALVTLAIGFAIAGLYYYRVRQLEAINQARAEFTQQLIESQERERSRIAMELHDSLGQSLAVIRNRALMGLSTPEDNGHLVDQMTEISEASAAALEETRAIAHNLHPYQLEHLGLTLAVRSLVESVESSSGLTVDKNIDELQTVIPVDAAINVYRIAQESLSNIIKHSGATTASVSLHDKAGRLVLKVSDNGRGFDSTLPSSGLGLKGVQERAKMLKADLRVHSEPGRGSSLDLSFDLPVNGHEQTDASGDRG